MSEKLWFEMDVRQACPVVLNAYDLGAAFYLAFLGSYSREVGTLCVEAKSLILQAAQKQAEHHMRE